MSEEAQGGKIPTAGEMSRWRSRMRIVLVTILVLLIAFLVPPWINIGRYQKQIVRILSDSVGRPVEMSSVEMRLLPLPGFLVSNLSIAEDPAYGAEPVLHASSVRANIRLLSLWRGRLEIGSIVVDEASLNIVRAGSGQWNLDPLLHNVAAKAGAKTGMGQVARFPSLTATNSRINFKNGAEKLPFSLVNTDLSVWQQSSSEWRIRLLGQPARTDFALQQGDTGTVRIEAGIKRAAQLSELPLNIDLEWKDAQLGQLSRLVFGSDPGWRGDLRGNLHIDGTPGDAHLIARLRANGVHREEFASPNPLDFDVNCGLVYHYGLRRVEGLNCDSPLGNGRIKVAGGVPGGGEPAHFSFELDKIPVDAGLDMLRTMRSGLAADLLAAGTVSGRIDYVEPAISEKSNPRTKRGQMRPEMQQALKGTLTISDFSLKGGSLSKPITAEKAVLSAVSSATGTLGLGGTATFNLGGSEPLSVGLILEGAGYEENLRGQASIDRVRELLLSTGWPQATALKNLSGDPLTVAVSVKGPWIASIDNGMDKVSRDAVQGTVTVRNAKWKSEYLANTVDIAQATLNVSSDAMRWERVAFAYGPVKGTAAVLLPLACSKLESETPGCAPEFKVAFGSLDASVLEAAILGAHEKGSVISNLIERLRPAAPTVWPKMHGTMSADALTLGPVKLEKASSMVEFSGDHADLTALKGKLLGGAVEGSGTIRWAQSDSRPPSYLIEARSDRISAALLGQLLGQKWSGGTIAVEGKLDAAGFTEQDFAATAKGELHFVWNRGTMAATRFDSWSGDATIGNSEVTIGKNEISSGGKKQAVEGSVTFGAAVKAQLGVAKSQ